MRSQISKYLHQVSTLHFSNVLSEWFSLLTSHNNKKYSNNIYGTNRRTVYNLTLLYTPDWCRNQQSCLKLTTTLENITLQMLFSSRPHCNTSCHVHNIKEPIELHAKCSHDKDVIFTWWIQDDVDGIVTDSHVLKKYINHNVDIIIVEGKLLRCLKITKTDVLTVNTSAGFPFVTILDHTVK